MWNKARTTQSNPRLDQIEVGCLVDGSHMHPDDFSVAVLDFAKELGYKIGDEDLVHVLIRKLNMADDLGQQYAENYGHYLSIASDEAVDWMNENIVTGDHIFVIDESSLFLQNHDAEEN